jgi:hypothetical protein
MTLLEDILENYPDDTFVKMDGYDHAVIGVCLKDGKRVLLYSLNAILAQLEEEMSATEAEEFYGYNIERTLDYLGPQSPVILFDD